MDRDKLMKMASAVRTGGKGTVRRKKKAVHKTTSTDDKRLQNTLKRLGVNTIPAVEEVHIVKDDQIIHFMNPKVQASIAANTYVVSGPSTVKSMAELQDMLPGMYGGGMPNLGGMDMAQLQKLAAQMGARGGMPDLQALAGIPGLGGAADDADDDDVPDLVDNFEEVAK